MSELVLSEIASPDDLKVSIGNYCSGVVVVTAQASDGALYAMTCQSFHSLSLDPPLVAYFAGKGSRSYAALRRLDDYAINVLAEDQEELAMRFARSGPDKWAGTGWTSDRFGQPHLHGCIANISCRTYAEYDGGDHLIHVGRVNAITHDAGKAPLLFFRSRFTRLERAVSG
ncbi:flavin reductase family protein [Amorphus sp. 3PC139-8]|uniref:flavin reductase family protein n=1 Tax=Amorphus sp. 3PC139-8 TaxID=2735676 RepID=UPI00345D4E58